MHIVTGSDENYVPGAMVLIASAAWHNPGARFTLLDAAISGSSRGRIDRLAERLGVRIDRVEIDAAAAFEGMVTRRSHLTPSTFLRLAIPGLLPDEDRVIYMDSDMVVTDDLSPLWAVPLGDAAIAAVADPEVGPEELAATGTRFGEYVNAGLQVMNLPVWRRDDLVGACRAVLSDPDHPRRGADQSAINAVCRGRIVHLPGRYNVFARPGSYRSAADLPDDPAVLHFVVGAKPWRGRVAFGEIWQFHADRIADLLPSSPAITWRQRLNRLTRPMRSAAGLAVGRPKTWRRLLIGRAVRDRVVRPYLRAQAGRRP